MAKQIAEELQDLHYTDRHLNKGFSDAMSGRPATSHDHLLARLNDQLIELRRSRDASRAEADRLRAEVEALRNELDSIRQYGSDTLSGRTDGPDDRAWQRAAVLEMTNRAIRALKGK